MTDRRRFNPLRLIILLLLLVLCCCLSAVGAGYYFLYGPGAVESIPAAGVSEATVTPFVVSVITETAVTDVPESPTATLEPTPGEAASPTSSPTPTATATPEKDPILFAAFIVNELLHFSGSSEIGHLITILGADPEPVEGAEITMTMLRPDGTSETLTATSDAFGLAILAFDIFVFGEYQITIDDIQAPGYDYDPALNITNTFIVPVGSAETQLRPASRLEAFYAEFNAAMTAGDADTLFSLLHPAVLDRYGAAACQARLEEIVQSPVLVEVLELLDFGVWDYMRDERTTAIENTYGIGVQLTLADGSTSTPIAHLALRDNGSLGWFSDCGDPLE
jgi:hypothetical protein